MKIGWFPGHMHRARKVMAELMPRIDVVIEVLDARLPRSSSNPLLDEMRQGRPCLKVLNKSDLADPQVTTLWVAHFQRKQGVNPLAVSATSPGEVKRIKKLCLSMSKRRPSPLRPVRAMIVGIPNVGKSTLMNALVGRRVARAANEAAITRKTKHIDLSDELTISDTPGILWPNLEDQQGAFRLAASGAIRESALDFDEVALFAADFMLKSYPDLLAKRYKLKEMPENGTDLLTTIGAKRGCLIKGGEVDWNKVTTLFLNEFRGGLMGRISLERPGEE
jgi:ribosome biogenesis GTPase A